MRKLSVLMVVLVLSLLFAAPVLAEGVFRPLPQYFFGQVFVQDNGELVPAPSGTVISVRAQGEDRLLAIYAIGRSGRYGDINSPGRCLVVGYGGLGNGDILEFYLNGKPIGTRAIFQRGAVTQLDIGADIPKESSEVADSNKGADGAKQNNEDGEAVSKEQRQSAEPADITGEQPSDTEQQSVGQTEAQPEAAQPSVTFDDIQGHPLQREIEQAAAAGIVKGVSAKEFQPDTPVTRAQFTVMLVEALDIKGRDTKLTFLDVSSTDWFYSAVKRAYSSGIVQGFDNVEFRPDASITREQAAAVAVSAIEYQGKIPAVNVKVLANYDDNDSVDEWAKEAMAVSIERELIKPLDGKLAPDVQVTRAEAAAMLVKLVE